jgi:tRNA threonylcarbamoyladenosine biosynthesis protein TsaE
MSDEVICQTLSQLDTFANKFIKTLTAPKIIFLEGELAAGKTTFVRFVLRAMGYTKKIKSPTYTLIETHLLNDFTVFHLDLYRINEEEEILYIGIEDIFTKKSIVFIEWASKAYNLLPDPDITLQFNSNNNLRSITQKINYTKN